MARSEIVKIRFTDKKGKIEKKIIPDRPLASRGGEFVCILKNDTKTSLGVSLREFDPAEYLHFDTDTAVEVPPDKKRAIVMTVVDDDKDDVPVKYQIWVGVEKGEPKKFDPELVIEGDGTRPPPQKKKQSRKKKKKKGSAKGARKR